MKTFLTKETRPAMARIVGIVRALSQAERPQTAERLAERFECSIKSIYRDMDFLRDSLHVPIKSTQDGGPMACLGFGYYLAGPVHLCAGCMAAIKAAHEEFQTTEDPYAANEARAALGLAPGTRLRFRLS